MFARLHGIRGLRHTNNSRRAKELVSAASFLYRLLLTMPDHHLNDWHAPGSPPLSSYFIVAMKAIQVLVPLLSSLRMDR